MNKIKLILVYIKTYFVPVRGILKLSFSDKNITVTSKRFWSFVVLILDFLLPMLYCKATLLMSNLGILDAELKRFDNFGLIEFFCPIKLSISFWKLKSFLFVSISC